MTKNIIGCMHSNNLCSCSCCANGCGEDKCLDTSDNGDFASYIARKSSCLEKIDDSFRLTRKHQYYYQVQQQLQVTGREFCDFVVCVLSCGKPTLFLEHNLYKYFSDINHWEATAPKLT